MAAATVLIKYHHPITARTSACKGRRSSSVWSDSRIRPQTDEISSVDKGGKRGRASFMNNSTGCFNGFNTIWVLHKPVLPISLHLVVVGVLYPTHKQVVESKLFDAIGRVWLIRHDRSLVRLSQSFLSKGFYLLIVLPI